MKLMRYSKRPVLLANVEAYEAEFKAQFDLIIDKHTTPELQGPDMIKVQADLEELDKVLYAKYPTVEDIEMPKSNRAWNKLAKHYGVPIMVAQSSERPGEVVAVLLDEDIF